MNFEIKTILLLSLFSPLVELFPNLYMSWWEPSNGKLQKYLDAWPRRIMVVLIVWLPILITLSKIIRPPILIWLIGAIVFSAFGLRLHFFKKYLVAKLTKGSSLPKLLNIPEFLYFLAFSTIGVVIYGAVSDKQWLVPLGILSIFFGASIISTFREGNHKNLTLDIIGRLVFIAGFLLNLYNLSRGSLL